MLFIVLVIFVIRNWIMMKRKKKLVSFIGTDTKANFSLARPPLTHQNLFTGFKNSVIQPIYVFSEMFS